tara:strand:- start:32223 stop:32429 length:207 start_codon:yes stop_codon:yes gene_type:complete
MNTYQLQLTQTLYWTVEIEVDEEDHDIQDVIHDAETSRLSELEDHYSFADNEEREATIISKDGKNYEF